MIYGYMQQLEKRASHPDREISTAAIDDLKYLNRIKIKEWWPLPSGLEEAATAPSPTVSAPRTSGPDGLALSFAEVPALGTAETWRGQSYGLVGARPFAKVDGSLTHVLTWRSSCPACGGPFEVTAPVGGSRALNRRCGGCKRPGVPVMATERRAAGDRIAIRRARARKGTGRLGTARSLRLAS